jgi:hypothetical protein
MKLEMKEENQSNGFINSTEFGRSNLVQRRVPPEGNGNSASIAGVVPLVHHVKRIEKQSRSLQIGLRFLHILFLPLIWIVWWLLLKPIQLYMYPILDWYASMAIRVNYLAVSDKVTPYGPWEFPTDGPAIMCVFHVR